MYEFAVVTLFGLVALKVTDLLVDLVPSMDRIRTLLHHSESAPLDSPLWGAGLGKRSAGRPEVCGVE